jgi:hypothetical protein
MSKRKSKIVDDDDDKDSERPTKKRQRRLMVIPKSTTTPSDQNIRSTVNHKTKLDKTVAILDFPNLDIKDSTSSSSFLDIDAITGAAGYIGAKGTFKPLSVNDIEQKRTAIRQCVIERTTEYPDITADLIMELVNLYDAIFFEYSIRNLAAKLGMQLKLIGSTQLRKWPSNCVTKAGKQPTVTISISVSILSDITANSMDYSLNANGDSKNPHSRSKKNFHKFPISDRLQCLQLVLEHELVHAYVLMYQTHHKRVIVPVTHDHQARSAVFQTILEAIFGHQNLTVDLINPAVRHQFQLGDCVIHRISARRERNRLNLSDIGVEELAKFDGRHKPSTESKRPDGSSESKRRDGSKHDNDDDNRGEKNQYLKIVSINAPTTARCWCYKTRTLHIVKYRKLQLISEADFLSVHSVQELEQSIPNSAYDIRSFFDQHNPAADTSSEKKSKANISTATVTAVTNVSVNAVTNVSANAVTNVSANAVTNVSANAVTNVSANAVTNVSANAVTNVSANASEVQILASTTNNDYNKSAIVVDCRDISFDCHLDQMPALEKA